MDYSTAYSPTGSSVGRSWVAAAAGSPWDVPSREYREHRPGDDAAADDGGSVCRRRSRCRCRGVACGASACAGGSGSCRDLGDKSEDWRRRQGAAADTCRMFADAPPSAAVAAVAGQRRPRVAAAVVGPPLAFWPRLRSRYWNRPGLRRGSCLPFDRWNRRVWIFSRDMVGHGSAVRIA